jgi:SNF2 family DNA or RNA helicase
MLQPSNTPLLPLAQKAIDAAVPFQVEDAEYLLRHPRSVLGHKTGLGKTFISILAWSQWPSVKRALIVGTLASINTWRNNLAIWGGAQTTFMQGSGDPGWQSLMRGDRGIWLCTYATYRILIKSVPKPKRVKLDLLITDELHKALRNRTQTFTDLCRIDCDFYIGATATWASKGPQDLWPVLHIVDRRLFSSYWRFVDTWCYTSDGSFGKEIIGVKNSDNLRKMLRGNYYRSRTWSEVGSQFQVNGEPIVRRVEYIKMSDDQAPIYNGMYDKMEARHGKHFVLAQNSLDKLTKCLQLALSPRLIHPEWPIGGPVNWLVDKLLDLESNAVVFIPFKDLADVAGKHLLANGYEKPVYFLYGGISPEVCATTIDAWRRTGGVVFCTISYAQSFALDATDYSFFLGFDWDPNNNIQAEGRLRRLDSVNKDPCMATYLVVEDTEYYKVQEVVNGKVENVRKVFHDYAL